MSRLSPSEMAEFLDDAYYAIREMRGPCDSLQTIWDGYFAADARAEMPQTLDELNETWPQKRGTP